jgi:hypothetical protein
MGELKGSGIFKHVEGLPDEHKERLYRFTILLDHKQRGCVSALEVAAHTEEEKGHGSTRSRT